MDMRALVKGINNKYKNGDKYTLTVTSNNKHTCYRFWKNDTVIIECWNKGAMYQALVTELADKKNSKLIWVEKEELPALGWITITDIGEENMYFFKMLDGKKIEYFVKL